MKLFELAYACRLYPYFGDFDRSLTRFRQQIGSVLDINNHDHCIALFEWLNSWGCRQFAKKDYAMASRSLVAWGKDYMDQFPPKNAELLNLPDAALQKVAKAYSALKTRQASTKFNTAVGFGPTGTAKVLFALRPRAFTPWDDPIRKHLEYDGSGDSYLQFLRYVRNELQEAVQDAFRLGIRPAEIPSRVDRPDSTLAKLIDEYHWIKITKKVELPNTKELKDWLRWAQKSHEP